MNTTLIHGRQINSNGQHLNFWDVVNKGQWEPEIFDILDNHIKAGKVFIDIGSWNGICSLYASKLGAVCYAIEPDPAAFKELTENVNLNEKTIFTNNIAIADKDSSMILRSKNDFGDSESSLVRVTKSDTVIKVKAMTLESFITAMNINIPDISLIKIDIEGGEILLLKQAKEFLAKHKPTIYISFHPGWFPDRENDINEIADIIFPIYKVAGAKNPWEFRQLLDNGIHTFLLTWEL